MTLPIRRLSRELLDDLRKKLGVKKIADHMILSEATINKWCQNSGRDEELPFEPSGRQNPIDRVEDLLHLMVSEGLDALAVESINHLAREVRGLFMSMEEVELLKKIAAKAEDRKE